MNAKTQARIDAVLAAAREAIEADNDAPLREAIRLAILDTDRDTRHACADAVSALATTPGVLPHADAESVVETCQAAHQACMNTQAV